MLVLTRKPGQKIVIGDDIEVTILDVRGEGIRVGITAPRDVRIRREEVLRAVEAANREATRADDGAAAKLFSTLPRGRGDV